MTQQTQVPVVVSEEAAARVAELGIQREMEQMIDHARATAPGLHAIHVELEYDPSCVHRDPLVAVIAYHDVPPEGAAKDRTSWDWAGWEAVTFPGQVLINMGLFSEYGEPYGR
jgi:hypothetical protein